MELCRASANAGLYERGRFRASGLARKHMYATRLNRMGSTIGCKVKTFAISGVAKVVFFLRVSEILSPLTILRTLTTSFITGKSEAHQLDIRISYVGVERRL